MEGTRYGVWGCAGGGRPGYGVWGGSRNRAGLGRGGVCFFGLGGSPHDVGFGGVRGLSLGGAPAPPPALGSLGSGSADPPRFPTLHPQHHPEPSPVAPSAHPRDSPGAPPPPCSPTGPTGELPEPRSSHPILIPLFPSRRGAVWQRPRGHGPAPPAEPDPRSPKEHPKNQPRCLRAVLWQLGASPSPQKPLPNPPEPPVPAPAGSRGAAGAFRGRRKPQIPLPVTSRDVPGGFCGALGAII